MWGQQASWRLQSHKNTSRLLAPGLKKEEKATLNGIVLSRVLGEDTECEREG